jgi:hypothetical protein
MDAPAADGPPFSCALLDAPHLIRPFRRASGNTDAAHAVEFLAAQPREQIAGAAQPFWDLMADSYRGDLWAATYMINGGASDDGFDYFRGWLIAQGRQVFERVVADPDSQAERPTVRAAAATHDELECEEILGIAWNAHLEATGSNCQDLWMGAAPTQR